jgi:hypothetical protein
MPRIKSVAKPKKNTFLGFLEETKRLYREQKRLKLEETIREDNLVFEVLKNCLERRKRSIFKNIVYRCAGENFYEHQVCGGVDWMLENHAREMLKNDFECPISLEMTCEPRFIFLCNHYVCAKSLERMTRGRRVCPLCRAPCLLDLTLESVDDNENWRNHLFDKWEISLRYPFYRYIF